METGGNEIKMKPFEGFNYPEEFVGNVAEHLHEIKIMDIRPDDVFITSYPKSGEVERVSKQGLTFFLSNFSYK